MVSAPLWGRASALPLDLIAQAIPKLSRHDLEALAERLIDHLDVSDAPSEDLEPEQDCCGAYDDRGSRFSIATRYEHGTAICDDHDMPCPDWGTDQRQVILPH
ncbi:hypothetical protein [Qipengyuania oceanensis]|uniref:Uncharacterized protein n=1 Tax=Qipengyuania oceanensis TaxID=1463597 RepID=A0A844YK67_9SPHN|nr:hypothetical protein [Qipengyuania oceanensis]MXO63428.1 hypothetical protein [Qipengyuania oceanensis]